MNHSFNEKITPFLSEKISDARRVFGHQSSEYLALTRQYQADRREVGLDRSKGVVEQPYALSDDGSPVAGVHRLHPRTATIRLTDQWAAHCRWYPTVPKQYQQLTPEQLDRAARFLGSKSCDDIREVIFTGGDPMTCPEALGHAIDSIAKHAANVSIVRVETGLPVHDPSMITNDVVSNFSSHESIRFEVGVQFNHAVEFWSESLDAIRRLQDAGALVYNRQVLLKGVNDSVAAMTDLYERLRENSIEPDVLYHCAPIWGMDHYRTSLNAGFEIMHRLSHAGAFSGRSNPTFAANTELGIVTLHPDSIVSRNSYGDVLLQTGYNLEQRMQWDRAFMLPRTAEIDDEGYLRIWYNDGIDVPYCDVQKRSLDSCEGVREKIALESNGEKKPVLSSQPQHVSRFTTATEKSIQN